MIAALLTRNPAAATRRLLRSPLVDLLVGPHGIDRYLELIRSDLTVREPRAEVVTVRRQTPRSVTLTLRCNGAWGGFRAGQFVAIGVEIDGVRRTRTYSPACSEHGSERELELTITAHETGLVSRYLQSHARPGMILHLGAAQGGFVLPRPRPETLMLISGGSGITPVLSMLRTLCDEDYDGQIVFLHFARTAEDWLYRSEVEELARRHPNLSVSYSATREGDEHISAEGIRTAVGDVEHSRAAVCGPAPLIDAVRDIWGTLGGSEPVLAETFTAPRVRVSGAGAPGTLRFLRSELSAPIGDGTLLEQAEAAGLSPAFGCRMGICHTCTCRKTAGAVRNALTGELSAEDNEEIQLCVSVPAGDVALEI